MAHALATTGIVLSGGGARAAYQVGALRAIARILDVATPTPFAVICGTSAGAINAAALAGRAESFRNAVARLVRLWRNIDVGQVYKADLATVSAHGVRWLASVLTGKPGPPSAASMFDNRPLRRLLRRELSAERVAAHVADGRLRALAINATSYSTGHAVTFYQGAASLKPWHRMRRRGEATTIGVDHLLASTAIPFIFPATRVGREYFADGSVRQIAPLSPALHLGARRLLIIAVGQFTGQAMTTGATIRYPSFAQVAGHALSSIFLDNLGADLERMVRVNDLVDLIPPESLVEHGIDVGHVDALVLGPSRDLAALAVAYGRHLPAGVRYLLGGLGGTAGTGANLLSYLLFDSHYCRALMALGYSDAMARREEIAAFLESDVARFVPVLPADRQPI
ncbi:MAG TPA: patatin-like phospholipase family protein [Casimicrobiaceae bacterium]|nr:patatin-like phospholipase family protein [Casimicrobiaceae bacterium]